MSVKELVDKLKSDDATERLKSAAELGEDGSEEDAFHLVDLIWNDPSSTVSQIAVQAYSELLKEKSFDLVKDVIEKHKDEYVVLYAINILGSIPSDISSNLIDELLDNPNDKIRTAAIRSAISNSSQKLEPKIRAILEKETYSLAIQNCIEALTLWRIKKAKKLIKDVADKFDDDLEINTISNFSLASFGDKDALQSLKNNPIDEYKRITVNGSRYSGRDGLLEALKNI